MRRREYRHEMDEAPVTGHHYWQMRKVERPSLDDERRMSLVSDIPGGKTTPEVVRKDYCLASVNSIYTWIEYSHKIVGWSVGPTLETTYPLEALRMALPTIDDTSSGMLIHHSDRGCQYCSNEYVAELKKRGVSISMTQSGDPLENAVAERANGILKVEWLYKMTIATRSECRPRTRLINNAVIRSGAGKKDTLWDKINCKPRAEANLFGYAEAQRDCRRSIK